MTDGGVETDAINGTSTRSSKRPWIVAIVAGVVLLGCAAVLLLMPVTTSVKVPHDGTAVITETGEFGSPYIETAEIDCGAPITLAPDAYSSGGSAVLDPCGDEFRTRRVASGLLIVVGIALLTAGLMARRRDPRTPPRVVVVLAGVLGVIAVYLVLTSAFANYVPRAKVLPSPGWIPGPGENWSSDGKSYLSWERGTFFWHEVRYCMQDSGDYVISIRCQIEDGLRFAPDGRRIP